MAGQRKPMRVLMYSHDTFGLGHLRRTRAIANSLVEQHRGLSVLLVSGSAIAGAFEFKSRVDFIKIPSVIKLRNGDYESLSKHIDISCTLDMRRAVIEHAAVNFRPDVFIVDKEPRGLKYELDPTLARLKDMDCRMILGLREVLDDPKQVTKEWSKNKAAQAIETYYDDIWVYGSKDFWDPLSGVALPESVRRRMSFKGFISRSVPRARTTLSLKLPKSFVLVTAGGGGDGYDLMDQVMAVKESGPDNGETFVLVPGPFMSQRNRAEIRKRANGRSDVLILDFDNRIEMLMQKAKAVISMGGYNTFCELMSLDKRALIVPRTAPRKEQLIRATRASECGLVDMILPDEAADPVQLGGAIEQLMNRPLPSEASYGLDLDGLKRIGSAVSSYGRRTKIRPYLRISA